MLDKYKLIFNTFFFLMFTLFFVYYIEPCVHYLSVDVTNLRVVQKNTHQCHTETLQL